MAPCQDLATSLLNPNAKALSPTFALAILPVMFSNETDGGGRPFHKVTSIPSQGKRDSGMTSPTKQGV
eukprot:CAMPEP_0170083244 /NCGR_PEP_ID=MMETSP0019_2-20121128/18638_1 /TAXON_ID=98059 /ORGANISM="Dinobryon sp., Strain UTEXLB2267" /LENGTH=67 /DNA_ID=CAMNT_0010298533 /DNA_START=133 /DNA_END=336 /DNA_ORIENTATION=-